MYFQRCYTSCVCTAGQTDSQRVASILWRVATDCDKAKLEVAKAGVVAPAVALLQSACRNQTTAAAAIEVRLPPSSKHASELCICHKQLIAVVASLCFKLQEQTQSCTD